MRRALVGFVIMIVGVTAASSAAGAATRNRSVSASLAGSGAFAFVGGCIIAADSAGTYKATRLAHGSYTLDLCVVNANPLQVAGRLTLTSSNGARVDGTIAAALNNGLHDVPVTVAGGTKRFAGATGSLVLDLNEFNMTNCDPRVGICFNWDETATLAGTIALHR